MGSVNVYETGNGQKSGHVVIRVPSDDFETAIIDIKNLAVTVERESINAQDVTEQYVDLEARLANARAEEGQYVRIMNRATDVEDVLKVAEALFRVRQTIEQLDAQLDYLLRQVDMSTINVSLTAEADVEVFGVTWSPLAKIKEATRMMLEGVIEFVNAIIGLLFLIPVFLLWALFIGLVGYGVRVLYRIIRKKYF